MSQPIIHRLPNWPHEAAVLACRRELLSHDPLWRHTAIRKAKAQARLLRMKRRVG